MAGISNNPNSPRQKMINLMYLVFIAMMALNVSSEVLDGFELVQDSLRTSIENATHRNEIVAAELSSAYQSNPEKVREWYQKSAAVKQRSDSLYNYIQDLKQRIADLAEVSHIHAAQQVGQNFPFCISDIALYFGQQGDCCSHRHIFKQSHFPSAGIYSRLVRRFCA